MHGCVTGGDTSYTNVEVEDQAVKDPSRLHDPAKLQACLHATAIGQDQHVLLHKFQIRKSAPAVWLICMWCACVGTAQGQGSGVL
jgi:hypothetical protein